MYSRARLRSSSSSSSCSSSSGRSGCPTSAGRWARDAGVQGLGHRQGRRPRAIQPDEDGRAVNAREVRGHADLARRERPSRSGRETRAAHQARSNTRTGLTLVDHLDELRTRIIIALSRFGVATSLVLLAEPPDPRDRQRAAAANWPEPITFGVTEPFTTTLTNAAYFGAPALAAGDPLPGLRVRPAGVQPDRAAGGHAAAVDGARAVHRGRRVLLLRGPPPGHGLPALASTRTSSTPRSGRATTTAS